MIISLMKQLFLFLALLMIFCSSCAEDDGDGIAQIFEGDLIFRNQDELDNFAQQGISTLVGDLTISPEEAGNYTEITDLSALSSLKRIEGSLVIRFISGLTDMTDFSQMEEITGSISVEFNPDLMNLNGLEWLTRVTAISVAGNQSLFNIDGISNLAEVESLTISRNQSLLELTNFSALTSVPILVIASNTNLTSLRGLESISSSSEVLAIKENFDLTDLSGLEGLRSADLAFFDANIKITNLDALSNFNDVRILSIVRNQSLTNFCGIQAAVSSEGLESFEVSGNAYNPSKTNIKEGNCSN